jgi:hypothetical protein
MNAVCLYVVDLQVVEFVSYRNYKNDHKIHSVDHIFTHMELWDKIFINFY